MKTALVSLLAVAVAAAGLAAQSAADTRVEAGWQALQQGDADRAASAFHEALQRNPRDANLHYGAGAAAHLLGRETDAVASLTRALTLNPRLTAASELLGYIQYQQGDLDAAIHVYEQALVFAAGRATMQRRLEDWRKEAAVHSTLVERNGARFSIIFDGRADQALASRASAVLERSFWTIGQKIGAYPSNRITVTLYTEQQFRDIAHVPAWSSGAFDGKIRIPVQGVSQNLDEFDHVLVHELTHAIVHGLAARGVPAWLQEGLATYFEPRDPAAAQKRLQSMGVNIPLSSLEGSFSGLNAEQARIAYAESLFAVDLLMHLANGRMAVLIQALGNGQTLDASFGQLGMRAADFEAQVARRLR